MTLPLILLAIPSIFLGMFLGAAALGALARSQHWLEPVFIESEEILPRTPERRSSCSASTAP